MRPTTGMPSFSRMKNSRFTWARRTTWPRFTRALVRGRRFTIVFIGLINVNQYYAIWQDRRIPVKFDAESSASVSEPSIRSAGRPRAAVPTWFAAMRTVVPLLAPLPLPIRFALSNPALFGYFFQRGFFVCLFFGHDFTHALGDAHTLGWGRSCSLFCFCDQERDFAFYVPSCLQLLQNLRCPSA